MSSETVSRVARGSRAVADALRVATLLSGVATFVWLGGQGGVAFFVVFAVLLLPRLLAVATPFDAAFCATLLVASWARQQQWYVQVSWVDEAVHSVAPGATAVAAYLMLARLDLMPDLREEVRATRRFSLVLLVTVVGLGLAALWEFFEWGAEQLDPAGTHVGYTDTISDMALGGLGALVGGALLLRWFRAREAAADGRA